VISERRGSVQLLVIGASTGGPPALTRLLAALPEDLSCAVMVAVHLPAEYTAAFARRLDQVSPLRVREAFDGMLVLPGEVAVARGGLHMRAARSGAELMVRLDVDPVSATHRPSIDILMASAADAAGAATLGVVLTGMGDDGLIGARAIRDAGGRVLVEAEETCVVYGMPRAVKEGGQADGEAPLDAMAAAILGRL
jgi:two-component system chemotaxis response regulator CheB